MAIPTLSPEEIQKQYNQWFKSKNDGDGGDSGFKVSSWWDFIKAFEEKEGIDESPQAKAQKDESPGSLLRFPSGFSEKLKSWGGSWSWSCE